MFRDPVCFGLAECTTEFDTTDTYIPDLMQFLV